MEKAEVRHIRVQDAKQLGHSSTQVTVGESFAAWKGRLDDLVAHGLPAPVLAIIDGNAGLRRAVELVWPKAAVQRCCVHKPHRLHGLRAHMERALSGRRNESARRRRRAPHVLALPHNAVEDATNHEHD
jgi:transposase-like protein